jgi:hypothetical protein
MLENQLDYFKCKDKALNEIEMNMVRAIPSLIKIMNMVLKQDSGKNIIMNNKTKKIPTSNLNS